jgi:hypothetical protein
LPKFPVDTLPQWFLGGLQPMKLITLVWTHQWNPFHGFGSHQLNWIHWCELTPMKSISSVLAYPMKPIALV